MDTFIRLFVNHRPVYGIGNNDIEEAFLALTKNDNGTQISREDLVRLLTSEGEVFNHEELANAFQNLVGKKLFRDALPKDYVTADEFANDLLGFEEYEEGDDENDNLNE